MRWVIIYTYEFARWFEELDQPTGRAVAATIDRLSIGGPALGRPSADHVRGSRHGHMKELRVRGTIRVLFAFDPSRSAVLLLAGDKRRKADSEPQAGPGMGHQGPDQGYALKLAQRFAGRLVLAGGERRTTRWPDAAPGLDLRPGAGDARPASGSGAVRSRFWILVQCTSGTRLGQDRDDSGRWRLRGRDESEALGFVDVVDGLADEVLGVVYRLAVPEVEAVAVQCALCGEVAMS